MKTVKLDYGDGLMEADLPDTATIVRYQEIYDDSPEVDPFEAGRQTLDNPAGMPPLREMAGPRKKVVIGFSDRTKGQA